jgi:superfamily II DNA or RNA helicase
MRPNQALALEAIDAHRASGVKSAILVSPTGSGKTVVAAELMRREAAEHRRVLFLAPRRELVHQCCAKLADVSVPHGVIMAGTPGELVRSYEPVQVASVDTLHARSRNVELLPYYDLVIFDEAHLSLAATREDLLGRLRPGFLLGLTATPARKDGRALGNLYERLICTADVKELTTQGYLVPAKYYAPSVPDLKRMRVRKGDYVEADMEDAMNQPQIVGDVVNTWLKRAGDRRTVVFGVSIKHSLALCEALLRAGVTAEHVDAETSAFEREAIFARFRSGATQVLTNCFLASYGFDLPELSCVVLARPTKSTVLYLQMVGRGLRTADGKTDCIVLDHGGCVAEHGLAADERIWSLDGERGVVMKEPREKKAKKDGDGLILCEECSCTYDPRVVALARGGMHRMTIACPECGHSPKSLPQNVRVLTGELVEVGALGETRPIAQMKDEYRELMGLALQRGYKEGFAGVKYKEWYGTWPPWDWKRLPPLSPSMAVVRKVKAGFRSMERA